MNNTIFFAVVCKTFDIRKKNYLPNMILQNKCHRKTLAISAVNQKNLRLLNTMPGVISKKILIFNATGLEPCTPLSC